MKNTSRNPFTTVRTEGAILPVDVLNRILEPKSTLAGLEPVAYHLSGESASERINATWARLVNSWKTFRTELAKLPEHDPATSVTRERWLLPLFAALDFGRLATMKSLEIGDKIYDVSHGWQQTPIHLVGANVELDSKTKGVRGATRFSPHSLVQETLNRSPEHLWGIVSNGRKLRVLRDNTSLTRQAYLEFDLETMFEGSVFSDFALLWRVLHQSRFEALDADKPLETWLERWSKEAKEQGTRALEQLRGGVERAINALGTGFLEHPANRALKQQLYSGELNKQDYYRELLRVVYRMIFLFVAEDRELLHHPDASLEARETYKFYSLSRIRTLAARNRTGHADLWVQLRLVCQKLGSDDGCPELGLPALGGFLFSSDAAPHLETSEISNAHLTKAVHALAYIGDNAGLRPVDFKNSRTEELGSVYEALLELHPELNIDTSSFNLTTAGGNERKTSGSYYTPDSLVQQLLNTALDPVLEEAASKPNPEAAILNLKICDPACGSGHFLIGAAHRIAKRLASVRTGEAEPSPEATRTALRDVIGRCVYGVDINPMSVELCKVALWMEALEPGKPLSFLEHHIRVGNSLLGVTPKLLGRWEGQHFLYDLPDDAFTALEGDDKKIVSLQKKANKLERVQLTSDEYADAGMADVETAFKRLNAAPDGNSAGINAKHDLFTQLEANPVYQKAKLLADAWCAAFVNRKVAGQPSITISTLQRLHRDPHNAALEPVLSTVQALREQYQFFHWHLMFPDVFSTPHLVTGFPESKAGQAGFFGVSQAAQPSLSATAPTAEAENDATGWNGGFDCVLGNPPWERVKLQEKEWFSERVPSIATAANASARGKLIKALITENPAMHKAFLEDVRRAEGESHLMRDSGHFPLCGRGDINTYAVFAETMRQTMSATGRAGAIVPSGIATDDTTKFFFRDIVETQNLHSLFDLENRENIFPAVDSRMKFCLLTLTGSSRPATAGAEFVFFAHSTDDLRDAERQFKLSSADIALLNPNTRTCAIFRSKRDAELTKAIYRRVPVLIEEGVVEKNPWGIQFLRMFDMSNDSSLFRTRDQLEQLGYTLEGNVFRNRLDEFLPLYEAKMANLYDHRAARVVISKTAIIRQGQPEELSSLEKSEPLCLPDPRFWVDRHEVIKTLKPQPSNWLVGWRRISISSNERTFLPTVFPVSGIGDSLFLLRSTEPPRIVASCVGALNAFVFDYITRQKMGGVNLSFFIVEQLPVISPSSYLGDCPWSPLQSLSTWILPRVLELTYTAWDLQPFAQDCGYDGSPYRWDEARRFLLRCELDAAYFHLYGINRDDVDYIMDTFPIVRRKDEAAHGEYRTKRVILEMFDAMQIAIDTGTPYQTRLEPPPAHESVAHPPRDALESAKMQAS